MQASPRSPWVLILTVPSAPITTSISAFSAISSPPPLGHEPDAAVLLLLLLADLVALALEVVHHARVRVALHHAVRERARLLAVADEGGLAGAGVHLHPGLRSLLVGDHQVHRVLPRSALEGLLARALEPRLGDGFHQPGHPRDDDLQLDDLGHRVS